MQQTGERIIIGDIVSGIEPSELVEVRGLSAFGEKVLVEGITLQTHREIKKPLTDQELSRLVKVRGKDYSFQGDPEAFLLGVEAERIWIAYQFDPLFAVNSSVVDPLPHQVEAVYKYLLPQPRIRFLLADDTGAGKTIMTGLLMKELLFRGTVGKILIVTPGGITKQWQEDELEEKFGFQSRLVNRASFEAEPGQFSGNKEGIFVVSIDFLARHEGCLRAAEQAQWDLIVVDEAHKLSAYEYGSKIEESSRYKAIKILAYKTDHLLFLTATPHRGRKDTFRRLLLLLDEDLFQKDEHVSERIREGRALIQGSEDFEEEKSIAQARNRFFLRRLKEQMLDWEGHPLFRERHTKTLGYDLTPEELDLYEKVTKYIRSKRKEAKAKKNQNVELALMVMQRRLASSLYAITRTLAKRLQALNEALKILLDKRSSPAEKKKLLSSAPQPEDPRNIAEYEEQDEMEREQVDKRIFRYVLTDDPAKVEEERNQVERLHQVALELKNHKEAKFQELLRVLDQSDVIRADEEKLLIFTEHRDTLENLKSRLSEQGYAVATIHGGMSLEERKQAQLDFRRKAKIMVATEAAGEGINLQFCRYLINWDIPWNPNRLEQRMGRVHRYGQKGDVKIYNLVAQNTREGAVLETVLHKLDVMREQLGEDRVYDVIDDWLEGVPLVQIIDKALDMETVDEARSHAEVAMESANEQKAKDSVAIQKKSSIASRTDLQSARELRDASDERRLQPLFIQRFFERAWKKCGGTIRPDPDYPVFYLGSTPRALLEVPREKRYVISEHGEAPFVFDKKLVSVASRIPVPEGTKLMGPGHPLFDALTQWAIRESREAFAKGALLLDPNLAVPQRAWLSRSTIEDKHPDPKKRIAHQQLVLITEDKMGLRTTSPSYLLNCISPKEETPLPDMQPRETGEIQRWAYGAVTEKQLDKVRTAREEECSLRRGYLNTAFTDLIVEIQEELSGLQQASLLGDEDPQETARLEERVKLLKNRKAERLQELDQMLELSANLPEMLTQAILVPLSAAVLETEAISKGVPMKRDDEVEAIAMDVVMRYERSRGWNPVDVHLDGEHYDIRSEGLDGEKRFIEVKGRASSGDIMITGPELDKLGQLQDRAWLYVVTQCKGEKPLLRLIQDPAAKLSPEMLYRQVQYLVKEEDWEACGEEVS